LKSSTKDEKKYIQQVLGTFLYYKRIVDSTMLTTLSSIASTQAKPTKTTMASVKLFLNYAATHQHTVLTYCAGNMVLVIHSDTSYLSKPKASCQIGGHFFMSSDTADLANNGAVLNIAHFIKTAMSSAAEAELGALYINARKAVPMQNLLQEMGHPQPPTPTQTNNSTALGVVTSNIQPRQTKSMDMRFYWLQDRKAQKQFKFFWRPGKTNLGDNWTKHHCSAHHIKKQDSILTPLSAVTALHASIQRTLITKVVKVA
jgi:hypothetical protein